MFMYITRCLFSTFFICCFFFHVIINLLSSDLCYLHEHDDKFYWGVYNLEEKLDANPWISVFNRVSKSSLRYNTRTAHTLTHNKRERSQRIGRFVVVGFTACMSPNKSPNSFSIFLCSSDISLTACLPLIELDDSLMTIRLIFTLDCPRISTACWI